MNDNIIKYENVKNESYHMINFHKNNDIEILLVHEFETDKGKDYIVVGKSEAGLPNATKEGATWCNLISEVVSMYKTDSTVLENNVDTYQKVENIPYFYFTKEGYDLITHRFLYTNNEIIRTVGLVSAGGLSYKDYQVLKYNAGYEFMVFNDYEEQYILRSEELDNMNFFNMILFIKANLNKVKKYISFNDRYSDYVCMTLFNSAGLSAPTEFLKFLKSSVNTIEDYNLIKGENIGAKKK